MLNVKQRSCEFVSRVDQGSINRTLVYRIKGERSNHYKECWDKRFQNEYQTQFFLFSYRNFNEKPALKNKDSKIFTSSALFHEVTKVQLESEKVKSLNHSYVALILFTWNSLFRTRSIVLCFHENEQSFGCRENLFFFFSWISAIHYSWYIFWLDLLSDVVLKTGLGLKTKSV